ncbi:MAG: hypothetical protein Q4D96_04410 [Propionibacteriaceae bacterium]|nr:hypothetical protein [Propionibacteriaceae bacterium]
MRSLRFLALILTATMTLLSPTLSRADEPGRKDNPGASARESSQPRETTTPGTGGGTGGADTGGGGSTSPAGVSVPRVMLESVVPTPRTVPAGSSFTLSYTLVNRSKKTRVSNLKVTLTQAEGAFLPANGSSSAFIAAIKPGGSVSRDMVFSTLPTLEHRPYAITMTIEYEDAEVNAHSTTETISVPVEQPTRADTSSITLSPNELFVGEETTVTFSLNNLGKSKIYNAKASIAEGQGVAAKEQFIGSVEPGASSNVELLLTATEEREEPVTAVISFEDATGTVVTMEKQLELLISAAPIQEGFTPPTEPEEKTPEPTTQGSDAWLWWVGGGLALAAALLIASLTLRRRAMQRREQSADLDLLDDTPLVGSDL